MIRLVGIEKTYRVRGGKRGESVHALRGVDLDIPDGSAISIIGESGCGKSTLGRIIAGIEQPTSGTILCDDTDITKWNAGRRREFLRGIQMIHQDPYSALNPVRTIDEILMDVLRLHARESGKDSHWVDRHLPAILDLVGLDPGYVLPRYPHQLSGGMRQRIVIARALAVEPKVLVADEAVSMIDVSLRLGILGLLRRLRNDLGISVVFITHDLASARYIGDNSTVAVLYRGSVVEQGPSESVISQAPEHPYTQALLSSIPLLRGLEHKAAEQVVPTGILEEGNDDAGCLFAPRCPFATHECRQRRPSLDRISESRCATAPNPNTNLDPHPHTFRNAGTGGHRVACWHPTRRKVIPYRTDITGR